MTDSQSSAFANTGSRSMRAGRGSVPDAKSANRQLQKIMLNLPPPGAMRWGARSKAAVVTAVRSGALTLTEARERYALSTTEYLSWETALDTLGMEGLGLQGRQLHRRGLTYCEK